MVGKSSYYVYALLLLGFTYRACSGDDTADCNAANGVGSWMGDGTCDPQNLSSECEWDGGDCCVCTCDDDNDNDYVCGTDGYLCLDPTLGGNITCEEESLPACPVDSQYSVVETTTDAEALATMINCSGGTFHVEWRGNIMVDTEIVVSYGTFLNVTGVGSSAVLDGGGDTRIFRVVRSSLHINNVEIRNGNATFGGAIVAINSTLALNRTSFVGSTAFDKNGGAVFVHGSSVSFSGQTQFIDNSAKYGGALYAVSNSSITWKGVSNFTGNSASHSGGALSVVVGSTVFWEAETIFEGNAATTYRGGALFLEGGSSALWNEEAHFKANWALLEGGAIFIDIGSNASWIGGAIFSANRVTYAGGGAILIAYSSTAQLSGGTLFEYNTCFSEGGAVSSRALDLSDSTCLANQESSLSIKGLAKFAYNTCRSNGGAIALLGGLSTSFESSNISFIGNEAGVAGGGVFLSTSGGGSAFTNASFSYNYAKVGGGVFISGSGLSVDLTDDDELSAIFDKCSFTENVAESNGGAIEMATGATIIRNTSFIKNKAANGGALWLAGATSLEGCTFEENISGLDGGQAISSVWFELIQNNNYFRGNVYNCSTGYFLDESGSGQRFSAICSGCENTCTNCTIEKRDKISTCTKALEHSTSSGGINVALQTLRIDTGYWRATNESTNIKACHNLDACEGGITGSSDYCHEGYTGPYCSVCTDGFIRGAGFTCTKCAENTWGVVVAVIAMAVSMAISFAAVKYLMSVEIGARPGIIARIIRRVPLQSVKTIIVTWQILTQFASVADITYPDLYQSFLNAIDFINFDLTWIISAGCFIVWDFHSQLLILTIWPMVVMMLLGGTYTYVVRRHSASEGARAIVLHKHVSAILLVMFLVYSSTSSAVFQMFDCEYLDDGKDYLRADYTIECDSSRHRHLTMYSGFMILVYPVGIPAFFLYLLFRNRKILMDEANREKALNVRSISDLWKPYRPSRFYYEVFECGRRIVLTGVVLIAKNESAAQIALTLMLAFTFTVVSEGLAPYESQLDAWVSRLGHAVVVASMYYALLLKVDISKESQSSQSAFDIVLIVIHVTMVLAIIGEALITAYSLKQGQVEDPWPRFQRYRSPRIHFETRSMSEVSPVSHESPHFKEIELGTRRPAPSERREILRPL